MLTVSLNGYRWTSGSNIQFLLYVFKAMHVMLLLLRSNEKSLLAVSQTHLTLKRGQVFAVAGPRPWNSLPHELREIPSLNVIFCLKPLRGWACIQCFTWLCFMFYAYSTMVGGCSFKVLCK